MKNKNIIILSIIIGISSIIGIYIQQTSGPDFESIDVESFIEIENEEDIKTKKASLQNYIWKIDQNYLTKLPNTIQTSYYDVKFQNFKNIERIDRISILMEHDVDSIAYMFFPKESNNELIIYHQGHRGDILYGESTIQYLLNEGYTVLAFSMPLLGENSKPSVYVDSLDKNLLLDSHDKFQFLENDEFSPIKFFIEPIYVSLNYVDSNFNFNSYHFIGLSGGGWTAIVYSSIDERISNTVSVAGSFPFYLRTSPENFGDYEQRVPELYEIANYLELYIMSSYGNGRGLLQIFNEFDPCCFSGTEYTSYEYVIKSKISNLGHGTFEIKLDKNNKEHSISDFSLKESLSFLQNHNVKNEI